MGRIKKILPGIVLIVIIAIFSMVINDAVKMFINLEALTIGILIGIIYNNTVKTQPIFSEGVSFSLKKFLMAGIVLLGFKLDFGALMQLGPKVLLIVLVLVPSVLILATILGRLFNMSSKLGTLIGVGSCICGALAVVAIAPTINAKDEEAVVAVSIVSLLGAVGVLVYSAVAVSSSITDVQYGVWSGISLHGVAHAIAAAFARGDQAGEIGTFVKMARVVMLVPVSIVLGYIYNRNNGQRQKAKFPMYVIYFMLAGVLNSTDILPELLIGFLTKSSSFLILMSMIAMGLKIEFKAIWNNGMKALLMGSVLFLITSTVTLWIITDTL